MTGLKKKSLNPNIRAVWAQIRVIELKKLLPADALPVYANCFAFARGVGILVDRNDRLFIIDLKSDKVQMVCEGRIMHGVVPCMSFYIPGTTLLGFCDFQNFRTWKLAVSDMKIWALSPTVCVHRVYLWGHQH